MSWLFTALSLPLFLFLSSSFFYSSLTFATKVCTNWSTRRTGKNCKGTSCGTLTCPLTEVTSQFEKDSHPKTGHTLNAISPSASVVSWTTLQASSDWTFVVEWKFYTDKIINQRTHPLPYSPFALLLAPLRLWKHQIRIQPSNQSTNLTFPSSRWTVEADSCWVILSPK